MKKADLITKKINRNNNTIFSHRVSPTNILTSDIFGDYIWAQNDSQITSGVQIIELRSSDSEKSKSAASIEDEKDYFPNQCLPWKYLRTNENEEDNYKLNEAARVERRRRHQDNSTTNDVVADASRYEDDFVYAEVFVSGTCDRQKDNVVYNNVNCFSILDKHMRNSDTSDEDYGDIEVINCHENNPEWARECQSNDGDMAHGTDNEDEKRTVWIYSFKNKHLLSENDFELIDIPSLDGSTNSSIEDNPQSSKGNNLRRISTPVPPLHVPRLHLPTTPPLPTVTEVTEPRRKSSANQTEATIVKKVGLKENNWFLSEHTTPYKEKVEVFDKSTSIVNWMALSPREKRRKFRNASPINLPSDFIGRLPTLTEVSALMEKCEELKSQKFDTKLTDINGTSTCEYGNDAKRNRDQSTLTEENLQSIHNSLNESLKSTLEQFGSSLLDSAKRSVRTIRSNLASSATRGNISLRNEIKVDSEEHVPEDRGDHLRGTMPRIKISTKPKFHKISVPMENIHSNDWIYEEKLVKDHRARTPQNGKGDSASDALWVRNMALLKPAEWTEYEQIAEAESIPSLHLSMNTDSIVENQNIFRRLTKCFSCCKICCE